MNVKNFSHKKIVAVATLALMATVVVMPAFAKTLVIDVRTPEEYQVNHPNGAVNIPHSEIAAKIASQGVTKQDTIKVFSRGGNRAEVAKKALQSAGYSNVEVTQ